MKAKLITQNKERKLIINCILAIMLSNLMQYFLFNQNNQKIKVPIREIDHIQVQIPARVFVPQHSSGKQVVTIISKDHRDVIKRAYLLSSKKVSQFSEKMNVTIEVHQEDLNKIMDSKKSWEVFPFTHQELQKHRKKKRKSYEIIL